MEFAKLGGSDLKVPVVGFGAWQAGKSGWGKDYTDEDVIKAMRFSIDSGVNYIDTAEGYGDGYSEKVIARALEGYGREDVIIATKVSPSHFKYNEVLKAADRSLKRLETDYIDLYQLHWPETYVPVGETVAAIEKLVKDGKVKYFGLCNFTAPLIEEIYSHIKDEIPIVSNQMRYNIAQREVEVDLVPYMETKGITMIAWSPLAKGLLTGKYNPDTLPGDEIRQRDTLFRKENIERLMPLVDEVRSLSEKYGKTMAQVALNYLITKEAVVIPGAKNVAQAKENMGAAGWHLSSSEVEVLDNASDVEIAYS